MTIVAGVSSSRQGRAPLNLAAQSRNTGDKIIATAIVERPWRPRRRRVLPVRHLAGFAIT